MKARKKNTVFPKLNASSSFIAAVLSFIILVIAFVNGMKSVSVLLDKGGKSRLMSDLNKKRASLYEIIEEEWDFLEKLMILGVHERSDVELPGGITLVSGDDVPEFEGNRYAGFNDDGMFVMACRDGVNALAAVRDPDRFIDAIFSTDMFMEDVIGICDSSGTPVFMNDLVERDKSLIEIIESEGAGNKKAAEQLRELLRTGETGYAEYKIRNTVWYGAVTSLGINDWRVIYRAEAMEYAYAMHFAALRIWLLFGVSAVIMILLVVFITRDIKTSDERLRLADQNTRASRECLCLLTENPGVLVLDVNLYTGRTNMYGSFMSKFGRDPVLTDFPYGAVHAGVHTDEDAQKIAHLIEQARRGAERGRTDIIMKRENGEQVDCVFSMKALSDDYGRPYRMIAVLSEKEEENTQDEAIDAKTGLIRGSRARLLMDERMMLGSCALVLCDMDTTQMDENFGYESSEDIAGRLAAYLKDAADDDDITARMGMNEFAVLLDGTTDRSEVNAFIAGVRRRIDLDTRMKDAHVRVYFGSALSRRFANSYDELYYQADSDMYNSRQQGGNRQ